MPLHLSVEAAIVSAAVLLAEALVMKVLGTEARLCLLCGCTRTCAVAHSSAVVRVVRAKKCIWAVAGRCID
jgi:hypothetical protein